MKSLKLICLLLLLLPAHLSSAEDEVYRVTLQDGRTMTGILEEKGLDRYTLKLLINGKIMGSKELTEADIKKKVLVKSVAPPENKSDSKDNKDGDEADNTSETADSPPKVSTADLGTEYRLYVLKFRDARRDYEGALSNLSTRATSLSLRDGIEKNLSMTRSALKKYLKMQQLIGDMHIQQIKSGSKGGVKEARSYYEHLMEAIEKQAESDITRAIAENAKNDMIVNWFKEANLDDADMAWAKGDAELESKVKKVNAKLNVLREIRSGNNKSSLKPVKDFIEHIEDFSVYAATR